MIERLWLILLVVLHALAAPAGVAAMGSRASSVLGPADLMSMESAAGEATPAAPAGCSCCCGAEVCPCAGAPERTPPRERPVQNERPPRVAMPLLDVGETPTTMIAAQTPSRRPAPGVTPPAALGPAAQARLCVWRT